MKARLEKRTAKFQGKLSHGDPAAPRQAVATADGRGRERACPASSASIRSPTPSGAVLYIGHAGGRSPFGLRSELQRELQDAAPGHQFRVEVNMQYRTRWLELLMVHEADHGSLPPDNAKNPPPGSAVSPLRRGVIARVAHEGETLRGHAWISSPTPNSRC